MAELHLDPHTLAYPMAPLGAETMRSFVRGLVDWNAVRRDGWVPILVPERTSDVLQRVGRMPPWQGLATALRDAGVFELQAQDIMKLLASILSRTTTVESAAHVNDVLCDNESVEPPVDVARRGTELASVYHRLLAMACLCSAKGGRHNRWELVGLLSDIEPGTSVHYSGELVDLDVQSTCSLSLNVPCNLDGTFQTVRSRESLYAIVDPTLLWIAATRVEERRGAIIIAEYQYRLRKGEVPQCGLSGRAWKCGAEFLGSAAGLGFMASESRARSLLRAIVETIQRVPQGMHALRSSSSGSAPQQRNGNAVAWRRDIDYEYHMHYWDGPEGCELANVVMHNDFRISV